MPREGRWWNCVQARVMSPAGDSCGRVDAIARGRGRGRTIARGRLGVGQ